MALLCGGGGGDAEDGPSPEEAKIDAQLKKMQTDEASKQKKIVKMLLLGAGESGKSTIFKQMKVIHKNGYSNAERKEFISIVHSNICSSMKIIFAACGTLGVPIPGDLQPDVDKFTADTADEKLTPELGALVTKIWAHPTIKEVFLRRAEYQLPDSADYFFDNVEKCSAADFLPAEQEILRSRVRTTGIVQSDFGVGKMNFSMFDVGGQRNERRKWIHCFDNVDSVVFVAALSEFDQKLFEDENKNRLDEALELFKQIVNSKWFNDSAVFLFLNKKDLFEKKLSEGKVFADFVSEYSGPNDFKACSEWCKAQFLKRVKDTSKSVYTHITTAVDTSNVKFIFNAVISMLLESNLKDSGLM